MEMATLVTWFCTAFHFRNRATPLKIAASLAALQP
jgi:hypothetical protein